jgi:hypothetical protein
MPSCGESQELVKQVAGVMGPRAGLGVVLHGGPPNILQDEPLHRAVVEIEMG